MTYLIDISHPNALDDRRVVDEVHDLRDVEQCLASPSFDWNVGDIVRVTRDDKIYFTGTYSENECINIGLEIYFNNTRAKMPNIVGTKASLVDIWQYGTSASNLLWRLIGIIDNQLMTKAAVNCTRLGCEKSPFVRNELFACLPVIAGSFEEASKTRELQELFSIQQRLEEYDLYDETEITDYAVAAVYCCARSLNEQHYASYALNNTEKILTRSSYEQTSEEVNRLLISVIKNTFSFQDVISFIIRQ